MSYTAPVSEILFMANTAGGLARGIAEGLFGDLTEDDAGAILAEAGRVATEVLAPIDRVGDIHGSTFADGAVTTPPGWKEAYEAWTAGGWNSLSAPPEWGGQGLPQALAAACMEMWNGAAMAFATGPLLTTSAIGTFVAHGSPALKAPYLSKLVAGTWMGTMQLTEPQAGSDVGALRTSAVRAPDGSYRISGEKLFISYGEHDLTENILHFVLARSAGAPPGPKGLSLFLVPKILVEPDGTLGRRNEVRAQGIERKLGLHGSPTCVMSFGGREGATGFLVGEEHRGMAAMFTMMNEARLQVALQGVGVAEAATQTAFAYARDRRQGRRPGQRAGETAPILAHPDVRRMLLGMRSRTDAARAICYATAAAIDRARLSPQADERAAAEERAALMTPIAKAYATDMGEEVASTCIQVHGGMGYMEDTGVPQLYRDVRVSRIYEGTNGIQAIDFVTRKLPAREGAAVADLLAECRATAVAVARSNHDGFGTTATRIVGAVEACERTADRIVDRLEGNPDAALAGASACLRLFAVTTGAALMANAALEALRDPEATGADAPSRVALARVFAETIAVEAPGLASLATEGADGILAAEPVFA